jgi:hypothetical protein
MFSIPSYVHKMPIPQTGLALVKYSKIVRLIRVIVSGMSL